MISGYEEQMAEMKRGNAWMLTSFENLVPGFYFLLDDLWLGCCIVDVDICARQGPNVRDPSHGNIARISKALTICRFLKDTEFAHDDFLLVIGEELRGLSTGAIFSSREPGISKHRHELPSRVKRQTHSACDPMASTSCDSGGS